MALSGHPYRTIGILPLLCQRYGGLGCIPSQLEPSPHSHVAVQRVDWFLYSPVYFDLFSLPCPLMTTTEYPSARRQRCSCVFSTSASRLAFLGLLLFCSPAFSQSTITPLAPPAAQEIMSEEREELRAALPIDFVEPDGADVVRARAEHLVTAPGQETVVTGTAKSPLDHLVEFLAAGKPVSSIEHAPEPAPKIRVAARIAEKYKVPPDRAMAIVSHAYAQAARHNLDPILVLSVIATESSFNPNAKSSAGALGLMQAIPRFHPDSLSRQGVTAGELYHPEKNIRVGVDILSKYIRLSRGNVASALQRYNGSSKDGSMRYSNKVFRSMAWLSGR